MFLLKVSLYCFPKKLMWAQLRLFLQVAHPLLSFSIAQTFKDGPLLKYNNYDLTNICAASEGVGEEPEKSSDKSSPSVTVLAVDSE